MECGRNCHKTPLEEVEPARGGGAYSRVPRLHQPPPRKRFGSSTLLADPAMRICVRVSILQMSVMGISFLTFLACFAAASAALLPAGGLPLRKYARTGITRTALDDYVDKPDSNYAFNIVREEEGLGFTAVFVNMTSQQWLTPQLVSRSVWFHGLVIMIPHKIVDDEHAFLYITGGGNDNPDNIFCKLTDEDCALGGALALASGTISAVLFQIPNAHIVFTEDPSQKSRSEDAIIAWTWFHFINNPQDSEWLLRLPMTKASVRAMDTVQAVINKRLGKNIEKFCVAGASKRGWTTWTTTIVDSRVIGSIPMVMDLLNFVNSTHHHYRALGGWTFAFSDYYQLNFTGELDNPGTQLMADIIDPYNYKDRLTMPMMLMTSSGDEFFMPDDSHWYFKELIQPKFMRVVGNAEHSLAEHLLQEVASIVGFYKHFLTGTPLPQFSWVLDQDKGTITVNCTDMPSRVKFYHARTLSSTRRDFRLIIGGPNCTADNCDPAVQPVIWRETGLVPSPQGIIVAQIPPPPYGWAAGFVQLEFDREGFTYTFTTENCITPNNFYYPDCHGQGCRGTLV